MSHPAILALALALAAAPALAQQQSRTLTSADVAKSEAARKAEPQITVQGAKNEQEAKARLRADAKLRECVIKPVMTDEEITACKTAYRMTTEAKPSVGR